MKQNSKKKLIIILFILVLLLVMLIIFINNKNKETQNINNIVSSIKETNSVELDEEDYKVSYENETIINLDKLEYTGTGVTINNNIITIANKGDYYITGDNDAQIIVDTNDLVHLILDNANLYYEDSAPIYVKNAKKVIITLQEGSNNTISDGNSYQVNSDDEPDGTIFSKDDLVINGTGFLTVTANYQDGIVSKDGLKIINTNINVTSKDDGTRGKDYIYIINSTLDITSSSDGIKSTNDTDSILGFVTIEDSNITIKSQNDGIQAETNLYLKSNNIDIITTGTLTNSNSLKGLKAVNNIVIESGTYNLNTIDDSVHSNNSIVIQYGNFTISSSDDGIHADNTLAIGGGNIKITNSYEGLESAELSIMGGNINILSTDDGINAAGGVDSSSQNNQPGRDNFSTSTGSLTISGGSIYVNAAGDGIDVNGSINMTSGTVIVNGPTDNGNGALDYDGNFEITGGILIASGSSGMAQMPTSASTQNSIMINFTSTITANSLISIQDSDDNEVITYSASKNYTNLVISSNSLTNGTYSININGESAKNNINGLYEIGGYINNTEYKTFTINSINTTIGTIQNNMPNTGGSNQRRR